MAYTKLTDFAVKDALLTGNPAKVVRGTEIDAELNAIAAADALNLSAASIVAATSKTTPIDADLIPLVDSAASNVLKKLTWANLKATLLTWLQGTVLPSPGPIGSTTPSTGAFTTLGVSGDITSSSTSGRLTFSNAGTSGNAGVQNNNGSAYALVYPSTHSTKPAHSDISSTTRVALQNAGSDIAVVTSTGLAVTGALSATGNITTNSNVTFSGVGAVTQAAQNAYTRVIGGTTANVDPTVTLYGSTHANAGLATYDAATHRFRSSTGTEYSRIDASGNLGVGVTPSAWTSGTAIQNQANSAWFSDGGATYFLNNAYYSSGFKYTASGTAMQYTLSSSGHTWYTAPSGTAGTPITWTQTLSVGKGTTLALEGATSAAGTGIAFPATQLASSNANTLDDYEEGTWTPSVGGTATYTAQNGRYTKVGRVVCFSGSITINAIGTGSTTTISGLPFTSSADHDCCTLIGYRTGSVSTVTQLVGNIGGGTTAIALFSSTAASTTLVTNAIFQAATRVDFSGTYYV